MLETSTRAVHLHHHRHYHHARGSAVAGCTIRAPAYRAKVPSHVTEVVSTRPSEVTNSDDSERRHLDIVECRSIAVLIIIIINNKHHQQHPLQKKQSLRIGGKIHHYLPFPYPN